jgi:hypothetical protein
MNSIVEHQNTLVDSGQERTDFSLFSMDDLILSSTSMENKIPSKVASNVVRLLPHPGAPRQKRINSKEPDGLELILLHDEFPKIIELTGRIKQACHTIQHVRPTHPDATRPFDLAEVQSAVTRIQATMVRKHLKGRKIVRGTFPRIDNTISFSVRALQKQWDNVSRYIAQQKDVLSKRTVLSTPSSTIGEPAKKEETSAKSKTKVKKEAIAIKYSKPQTDILMKWMIDHMEQPFPAKADILSLMKQTGLSESQVVNWTTNVRKRNRKATCEAGKKPHHYIDFLFLLHAREVQEQKKGVKPVAKAVATTSRKRDRKAKSNKNPSAKPSSVKSSSCRTKNSKKTTKAIDARPLPVPVSPVSSRGDTPENGDKKKYKPLKFDSARKPIRKDRLMQEFAEVWLNDCQNLDIVRVVTDESFADDEPLLADLCEMYDFSMLQEESLEKDWEDEVIQMAEV